jgi:hypothetical protein
VALSEEVWVVASDAGVYATVNSGTNWERLGEMPWIPVYDLVVDPVENRLVAGTFARSIQSFPTDSILAGTPPIIITCDEDIVINGIIDTNDVLLLLSQYGCSSGNCTADITGDGSVNSEDLLALLAMYGLPCID